MGEQTHALEASAGHAHTSARSSWTRLILSMPPSDAPAAAGVTVAVICAGKVWEVE